MNNLAGLYESQGKYDEAEPLYVECLRMRREVLGDNHPDTLSSMNNLAVLYKSQGKYDEAEPLYVECLRYDEEKCWETIILHTLISMNNLAVII